MRLDLPRTLSSQGLPRVLIAISLLITTSTATAEASTPKSNPDDDRGLASVIETIVGGAASGVEAAREYAALLLVGAARDGRFGEGRVGDPEGPADR
ncbi:hypothetical protein SAMN05660831_00063 [Thiohalospira halophila DSM 15071]|uniref:Uncharacterized protein n=1 Tax=Thiohalospira halophila DSM 15071 TaxID=1123397 RepID=A0A1I1N7D8_9GAMM|nr:hypothetical protein [Thiohalospira halophila]SFC91388.1 hypothetical protein SAMN05660831_00063 [Thiohalospira halophila DSM 15071]